VTSGLDASTQEKHRQFLEKDLIETIQEQKAIPGDDNNPLKIKTTQSVYKKSMDLLLQSLEYSGMQDREESIVDAHSATFRWIFEKDNDRWVSFRDWLESDHNLYWITGKAGSGKSTMMRYISHPYPRQGQQFPRSRSHEYLERWAGSKKLVVASFYFWNSGQEAQAKQRGLFMTLLRQIFEQCPDLLPLASRSRWENLCFFGLNPDWADTELRSLLLSCIENLGQLNTKVALFVDGLDEFDGDLMVLITLFEEIQKLPLHKLCVASRPWNEFRDAFDQQPSLMVEHLTRDDIKNFAIARFSSSPGFVQLRLREPDFANQLAENIVSKSSGVFLWVSLVVSSLLSGITDGDCISDLQQRLDLLPADLTDLYRKMIGNLKSRYLQHAAQVFALVRASREPMNLLLASYADEENPRSALRMSMSPITDQEVKGRMDAMNRRINSSSKGLLEVNGGKSTPQGIIYDVTNLRQTTIQYLHRTVKDFIEKDEAIQKVLKTALSSKFDAHLKLLVGHLAYLKKTRPEENQDPEGYWGEQLINCFFNARCVRARNIETMIELLDDLRGLCPPDVKVVDKLSPDGRREFNMPFMSLATACHVFKYIRARYKSILKPEKQQMPLLCSAIFTTLQDDGYLTRELPELTASAKTRYKAMIEVLLKNGEDPKFKMQKSSMMTRQTSPLVMAAVQYMHTRHQWYLIACRVLARNMHYDSTTIAWIIHGYMEIRQYPDPYKKRLGASFWSWHLLRRDVRKALNDTTRGCPPDFDKFWTALIEKRLPKPPRQERPPRSRSDWSSSYYTDSYTATDPSVTSSDVPRQS
jgi:hypothetical protein